VVVFNRGVVAVLNPMTIPKHHGMVNDKNECNEMKNEMGKPIEYKYEITLYHSVCKENRMRVLTQSHPLHSYVK
jgi:hypothetical protein